MGGKLLPVLLLCLAGWNPCSQAGDIEGPIAKGDWGTIRQADLDQARSYSPPGAADEVLIGQLARDFLGAKKAREAKLEDTPGLKWRLWSIDLNRGVRDLYQRKMAAVAQPTSEDLKRAYLNRIEKHRQPETFSFRYIFCDTTEHQDTASIEAARKKIEKAHSELLASLGPNPKQPWRVEAGKFNEVAGKYSDAKGDPTRVAGPFKMDEPLQRVIKDHALRLAPGEVSGVFSTKYGFEIVRLESHVAAATAEYESVAGDLRKEIDAANRSEAIKAYLDSLRQDKTRYEIFEDRFVRLLPGAHPGVPSATAALRVGKTYWLNDQVIEFMDTLYKMQWIQAREEREAIELAWKTFILPQLLAEDAARAGLAGRATEEVRAGIESRAALSSAWVEQEVQKAIAGLPAPSTEACRARYEKEKGKLLQAARYRLVWITYPISEGKDKSLSPSQAEFLYREGEKRMKSLLSEIVAGASPEQMAKAASSEARPLEYKAKWISEGVEFPSQAWNILKKVSPGSWAPEPLRTDKGVVLAKVEEFVPEQAKPFEAVFAEIRHRLKAERVTGARNEIRSSLLAEAKASLNRMP
jgi:parvulin-like peptidyl-prolyl isomerase